MSGAVLTAAIADFGTAKEIARIVGCSPATAGRYRRGETMPDPLALARLMGRSRTIADVMLRLAGLDDLSLDLREARLRQELQRLQAQRAGSPYGRRVGDVGPQTADQTEPGAMPGNGVGPRE